MPQYDKYQEMWDNMVVTNESSVIRAAKLILEHKETYQEVVVGTEILWEIVGIIHYREATCDFKTHLHNGDSLKARTKNVPSGRPLTGTPPFSWQESAIDALITLKKFNEYTRWTLPQILIRLEKYNGVGYLKHHPDVPSPYIWSGTSYYTKGKYASDGKFDAELVDKQMGAAPIFRYLTDKTLGLIS